MRKYYQRANAIVICYDLTNKVSFEDVQFWMNNVEEYIGDKNKVVPCILLGLKADLGGSRRRIVSKQDAKVRLWLFE